MARAARIALDLTLKSFQIIRPIISGAWGAAKNKILETKAKRIVDNQVTTKLEEGLDKATSLVSTKLTELRNNQLTREKIYLENELEKVNKKIANLSSYPPGGDGGQSSSSQALKAKTGVAWKYLKVECVPPMTLAMFNGPIGQKMESVVSGATNTLIDILKTQIKNIDTAAAKKIQEKEAAVVLAQEKLKVEKLKAKLEAEKKALDAKLPQKKPEQKPEQTPANKTPEKVVKTEAKKETKSVTEEPKKKPPKEKKKPKKEARVTKKGPKGPTKKK